MVQSESSVIMPFSISGPDEKQRRLAEAQAACIHQYAVRIVADAPPLTQAQIDRIVTIMRGIS